MAYNFKRYAALAAAVVCAASLTGCSDNGYMGTVDGMEIRNGIYLSQMMTAYNSANSTAYDAKEEAGDTSEIEDLFAETIDGVSAEEWIKTETLELVKRYVAVEKLFDSKGLSLSDEERSEIIENVNDNWDSESINYYGFSLSVQTIYGYPTLGEYYESIGIGKDSMKDMELNALKEDELFIDYFTNDEEAKVSEEEINAYLSDNYANVKYIQVPFKDYAGISLDEEKDAEEIAALKARAQSYVDRFNAGESIIDIMYEQDLIDAQNDAMVDAETALEADDAEQPEDFDAYMEEAKNSATAKKAETVEELETIISKESSSLSDELTEFIWKTEADGKAYYLEGEKSAYLVIRDDITTKTEWKENNKVYILEQITGDEFDEYLESVYADYEVDFDSYLLDKKYAPSSYKGF